MELERRERYHIENNICVNKCKPASTREENLKQMKAYNEANREKILEQVKDYYEANREAVLKKKKERVNCPHCNRDLARGSLLAHIKRKH
jgi:hypothetical protein